MPTFRDKEFGVVTVRRSSLSKSLKLTIAPNGTLRITIPKYAPLLVAKQFVSSQRKKIRLVMTSEQQSVTYTDGMQIGKSHHLHIRDGKKISSRIEGQAILVTTTESSTGHEVQATIREAVTKALRREAKSYLPRRLAYLASEHDFSYENVRFSHASSRWGSCSSSGTISLNIALMKLDFPLIDYVLIHELAHTVEMNHSANFWEIVERIDPHYKQHRKLLKAHTTSI